MNNLNISFKNGDTVLTPAAHILKTETLFNSVNLEPQNVANEKLSL